MLNDRKYINDLLIKIGALSSEIKQLKTKIKMKDYDIEELFIKVNMLKDDIESKENSIINILEANKELALENQYLRKKIEQFKKYIEKLEGEK